MKKYLLLLLSVIGVYAATPLGVLYESENTNNVTSPSTLTIPNLAVITNLTLFAQPASYAVQLNAAKQLVGGLLSGSQQDILASWVGGTTTLTLGGAQIISGTGTPTNGTAYVQRILYINSIGTNLNDTFWGNYGTNWYAIASTNGGSITENQFNFSDNPTANVTTNQHGLAPKLSGVSSTYLNGIGTYTIPSLNVGAYSANTYYLGLVNQALDPTTIRYDTNFSFNAGTLDISNLSADTELVGLSIPTVLNLTAPVGVSKLIRTDTNGNIASVTIGAGLAFDGTTLSQTGTGTNAVGISGSPIATYLTYWSSPTTITGSAGATFDGSILSLNGGLNSSSANISALTVGGGDHTGNVTYGSFTPTISPISNCNLLGTAQQICRYTRIGNLVTLTGKLQITRSSIQYTFEMALPSLAITASDFSATTDATGIANIATVLGSPPVTAINITADTATDRISFTVSEQLSPANNLRTIAFNVTYLVN